MSGPWEKYQAKESEAGPWQQFQQNKSAPKPPPRMSPGEAGFEAFKQSASLGFSDEGIGALKAAVSKLKGEGDFKDLYPKFRDEEREKAKRAGADQPAAHFAGTAAGAIGSAFIPGLGAAKGASVLAKAGKAALTGGLAGAGLSEANPIQSPQKLGEFAKDVAGGAALSGGISGAGALIGKGVTAVKPAALKEYAGKRALTAAGFMTKDINKLSPEQQKAIGRQLLDQKVVTPLASLDDVAERATAGKEKAGAAIGSALSNVDKMIAKLKDKIDTGAIPVPPEKRDWAKYYLDQNFQFNMSRIGERIRDSLVKPNSDNPVLKNEVSRLAALADDFYSRGTKSLELGNVVKGAQGKTIRFQSETIPDAFKKEVYTIIKEELEDVVGRTGNLETAMKSLVGTGKLDSGIAARNREALSNYKDAKGLYQAMKATEKAAQYRLGQTNVNRTVSLTDYIAGSAGLATGGPVQAIALGAVNKIARKYGASVQAVSADRLADGIQKVISKSPELLRKAGPVIEAAAKKGNKSLVAVHMALMKEPDYRALMAKEQEAPDETPMQRKLDDLRQKKNVQGGH